MTLSIIWFVEPAVALMARLNGAKTPTARLTTSSDEQFDTLMAGDVHMAVTSMDNIMDWNLRTDDADFIIVAQVEKTTHLSLMARPGLTSFDALRGGRVLVDAPENGFVVAARMILAEEGISEDDIDLIPAGGVRERLEALLAGQGDATLLGPPFNIQAAAKGAETLAVVNDRYPDYPGQGLVMRRSVYMARQDEVWAWLATLTQALLNKATGSAIARFVESGLPGPVAQAFAASLPERLVPDYAGVMRVIRQRRALDLRGGQVDYADIVVS